MVYVVALYEKIFLLILQLVEFIWGNADDYSSYFDIIFCVLL